MGEFYQQQGISPVALREIKHLTQLLWVMAFNDSLAGKVQCSLFFFNIIDLPVEQ